MGLHPDHADALLQRGFSRRQLGRIASLLTAGAALPFYNEFAMAQDAERRMGRRADPDAVRINQNENPMGPSKEGLEAMFKIAPMGWRYSPGGEQGELSAAIAEVEGVPQNNISLYAGSSDPLHRVSCAFTSPGRSWTMGDPGYGGGAPAFIGSGLKRVPLREDYAHDGAAMIKADPDAGVYYLCNPNNPTGTVTPRKEIDYLLANKKKDAVVLVDEAYIHFSDNAQPCSDLVKAGKDIIVLRTFSKIYGMAGLRMGFAMGRPDLLAKLRPYGAGFLPVTALACAAASMKVARAQQADPPGHLRVPGEEGRAVYPQRGQLLHDGSQAPGRRVRPGHGGREGDHRACVADVAHQGAGDHRVGGRHGEVQSGVREGVGVRKFSAIGGQLRSRGPRVAGMPHDRGGRPT